MIFLLLRSSQVEEEINGFLLMFYTPENGTNRREAKTKKRLKEQKQNNTKKKGEQIHQTMSGMKRVGSFELGLD
jgi:hypothetical protein